MSRRFLIISVVIVVAIVAGVASRALGHAGSGLWPGSLMHPFCRRIMFLVMTNRFGLDLYPKEVR